ncbi:Enoyl-CoA hydratase [Oopsacas minuta]|uniref:Enoyl-CoA hydratase n=1 Tax=Oopsacas minuta TaxID=111878 RepID=A0AAV7JLQ3_9METZ|nr:Enoyl-CoA hydratase [Oopsacas minuta]
MPYYVEERGRIAILHFNEGENRLNYYSVKSILKCLDEIEANLDFTAMITLGHDKYFTLGLDLDWIGENMSTNFHLTQQFTQDLSTLYYRLITFPIPTIAAINGHAYGAGTFIALCHDMLIMREDRGYFCLPEAKLTLPFRSEMTRVLVRKRIPLSIQSTALLSFPFSAADALKYSIIHAHCPLSKLLDTCREQAERLAGSKKGLDRDNLKRIKLGVFDWATIAYSEDQKDLSNPKKSSFSAYSKSKL